MSTTRKYCLTSYDGFALSVRFLHERHEQTKQDLKGLEETVVSKIHIAMSVFNIVPCGVSRFPQSAFVSSA